MSKFGVSATDNVDGISTPSLEPGKYVGATLKKVSFEKPVKEDGTELVNRINFLFETADGKQHLHTEYDVKETDEKKESKEKNMSIRVTHILSKFIVRNELNGDFNTFEEYANWIVNKLNGKTGSVKIDFIVCGQVYNNKAKAAFPGYPTFIVKTGEPLDFNANQKTGNAQYIAFQNNVSKPDEEITKTSMDSDF